jgi:two-component system, sensor histidine kinase RegB
MEIFANDRFQEVIIHDLRTPLNVIKLAMRMIDDSGNAGSADSAEDFAMIRSGEAEMERMLTYLVDVTRLPTHRSELFPQRFDPRRLIDEAIVRHHSTVNSARVEVVADGSVREVELDYARAKMAAETTLANVVAASGGKPVRIRLTGGPDRCILAFESDVPPRATAFSHEIVPGDFQRILGTPGERRGLDLAIASKVSTLFGGTARLEASPGRGTAVILDWPASL